jgi:hypothetical protein
MDVRPETLCQIKSSMSFCHDHQETRFPHFDAQGLSGYELKNVDFTDHHDPVGDAFLQERGIA